MSNLARVTPRNATVLCLIAAAIALSMASCTGADSTPKPQATKSSYSIDQLNEWYDALKDPVWDLRLVSGSGLDEIRRQIIFHTYALRDIRKPIEAEISKFNIPRDAVFIDVGCESTKPSSIYPRVFSDESFLGPIEYSMEVPPQASYGEPVPLKLTLENVSDETVSFILGGGPPHDFIVVTTAGEYVWHWGCAAARILPISLWSLDSGEKLQYTGEWQQVNYKGEPVPSGDYLVYGTLHTGPYEPPESDLYRLETKSHRLEILKP